jgi:hypothetical protein
MRWLSPSLVRRVAHGATLCRSLRSGRTGSQLLPGVHKVASHLDRWWLGTHHGAIRHRHLDAYLYEFTFRFNRRNSRARGLLFYRLMECAASTDAVPLRALCGGTPLRSPVGDETGRIRG